MEAATSTHHGRASPGHRIEFEARQISILRTDLQRGATTTRSTYWIQTVRGHRAADHHVHPEYRERSGPIYAQGRIHRRGPRRYNRQLHYTTDTGRTLGRAPL